MTAQATRRVWFTAAVFEGWRTDGRVRALRKAYKNAGRSDDSGDLAKALKDLRPMLVGWVASIDDVCKKEKVS